MRTEDEIKKKIEVWESQRDFNFSTSEKATDIDESIKYFKRGLVINERIKSLKWALSNPPKP